MKKLFLHQRLFIALGSCAILYLLAFFFSVLNYIAGIALLLVIATTFVDIFLLFRTKKGIQVQRILPEKLSNGDENIIRLQVSNFYPFEIHIEIIDEVPFQFQLRDFQLKITIRPFETKTISYVLSPKERGVYSFGKINAYASSILGLVSRRTSSGEGQNLPCYPSFIHLSETELLAMNNERILGGIKRIRRIGQSMEFEQIREYVQGDDIRTINWKATGKSKQLMVNQYQEERAQRIYMLVDKGRTMKMPFNGLSLLDYSINATMALSHVVLKKQDRAGMLTFSKKTEDAVVADAKSGQLRRIADKLYQIQTDYFESDFERLYVDLKHRINQRSLLLLFTNFETLDALQRQLKYLRSIAKNHLLVVVFFQNAEVKQLLTAKNAKNTQDIYDEIIAEKFEYEKKLIRQELLKYGIQSVYSLPENLSVSVINKYLEIKRRGMI